MKWKIKFVVVACICLLLIGCNEKKQEKEVIEGNVTEEQLNVETIASEAVVQEGFVTETDSADISGQEVLIEESASDEKGYITEDFGEIQSYGSEFYYDEETKGFYYNLEMFYLNSDFLYTMNDTLEEFYDGYLKQYQETEDFYLEQGESDLPEGVVPYSELLFLGIQYIDNDYVSLLFNDVTYMGGAHPYSRFDAITIDRCTGEEVTASQILGESDEEILAKVSDLMGLDVVADWEDIDFYLQADSIVFFYRMPGYWEDVVLGR